MPNDIERVIESLRGEDGVTTACETVEAWAKAGRTRDLVDLAIALEGSTDAGSETLGDHVEDQLALLPSDIAVDALLSLLLRDRARSVQTPQPYDLRVRAFASRLGFGQSPAAFLSAIERIGATSERHRELLACWMHEVVLRGTSLAKEPRAIRFAESLAKAGHPLAPLPLALARAEREAPSYLPLYGNKGLSEAFEQLKSGPMSARTIPPPADGAAASATRRDDPDAVARIQEAVRPWTEGSNGKVEAKLFDLSPAISGSSLGRWLLRALPLDATSGAEHLEVTRTAADAAFGALFAAAANGGAYSSGLGGAYGRLAAWTSLGALVAAPRGAGTAAIDAAADRCTFLTFRATGPWFHDVAWDLGILALRPDGLTVAVLAATDTD